MRVQGPVVLQRFDLHRLAFGTDRGDFLPGIRRRNIQRDDVHIARLHGAGGLAIAEQRLFRVRGRLRLTASAGGTRPFGVDLRHHQIAAVRGTHDADGSIDRFEGLLLRAFV